MKAGSRIQIVAVIAGVLLAASMTWSQAPQNPAGNPGPGMAPGFGERHPPMEQAFGRDEAKGEWWNNPKVADDLKLTADQRKAMDAILLEHRKKLIDLRANLQKAELEMEPLMGADQPNESQILAQIDKVAQARAELEKANARFLLGLRSKLTPEQWKNLQAHRPNPGDAPRGWKRPGNP